MISSGGQKSFDGWDRQNTILKEQPSEKELPPSREARGGRRDQFEGTVSLRGKKNVKDSTGKKALGESGRPGEKVSVFRKK